MKSKGLEILVTDSNSRFSILLTKELERKGFRIRPISSLNELEKKPSRRSPAAIVVGIYSKHNRRFEAAEKLKNFFPEIPMIILSSLSSAKDCLQSYELGASKYLNKSLDTTEVLREVARVTSDAFVDTKPVHDRT